MENIMNTSANVDLFFKCEIFRISDNFKIPVSRIFLDIVVIVINASQKSCFKDKLTEYQSRNPGNWEKINYSPDANERQLLAHARFVYNISISKLAFIGFILFWDILIKKYMKDKNKQSHALSILYNNYFEFKQNLSIFQEYCIKRLGICRRE